MLLILYCRVIGIIKQLVLEADTDFSHMNGGFVKIITKRHEKAIGNPEVIQVKDHQTDAHKIIRNNAYFRQRWQ